MTNERYISWGAIVAAVLWCLILQVQVASAPTPKPSEESPQVDLSGINEHLKKQDELNEKVSGFLELSAEIDLSLSNRLSAVETTVASSNQILLTLLDRPAFVGIPNRPDRDLGDLRELVLQQDGRSLMGIVMTGQGSVKSVESLRSLEEMLSPVLDIKEVHDFFKREYEKYGIQFGAAPKPESVEVQGGHRNAFRVLSNIMGIPDLSDPNNIPKPEAPKPIKQEADARAATIKSNIAKMNLGRAAGEQSKNTVEYSKSILSEIKKPE